MNAETSFAMPTDVQPASKAAAPRPVNTGTADPTWAKILLIGTALAFMALMLVLPLVAVFVEALHDGFGKYLSAVANRDAWSAIRLTLIVAGISVPLNLVFGLCAAWSIAKFEFRGKSLLITLIDLPFSVSPVISGLIYVLLCNARAMGEFGAVSVVSGHIRGHTNTMPLHVEILYNEYDFVGAFAVASLLALLALVTLVGKSILEWRMGQRLSRGH